MFSNKISGASDCYKNILYVLNEISKNDYYVIDKLLRNTHFMMSVRWSQFVMKGVSASKIPEIKGN